MLPIIGITMGDPSSIGPEISLKALSNSDIYEKCRPIIIGDSSVLEKAKNYVNLKNLYANIQIIFLLFNIRELKLTVRKPLFFYI